MVLVDVFSILGVVMVVVLVVLIVTAVEEVSTMYCCCCGVKATVFAFRRRSRTFLGSYRVTIAKTVILVTLI